MISRDEASGGFPGLPEVITVQDGKGHSLDITISLDGRLRECNL